MTKQLYSIAAIGNREAERNTNDFSHARHSLLLLSKLCQNKLRGLLCSLHSVSAKFCWIKERPSNEEMNWVESNVILQKLIAHLRCNGVPIVSSSISISLAREMAKLSRETKKEMLINNETIVVGWRRKMLVTLFWVQRSPQTHWSMRLLKVPHLYQHSSSSFSELTINLQAA